MLCVFVQTAHPLPTPAMADEIDQGQAEMEEKLVNEENTPLLYGVSTRTCACPYLSARMSGCVRLGILCLPSDTECSFQRCA